MKIWKTYVYKNVALCTTQRDGRMTGRPISYIENLFLIQKFKKLNQEQRSKLRYSAWHLSNKLELRRHELQLSVISAAAHSGELPVSSFQLPVLPVCISVCAASTASWFAFADLLTVIYRPLGTEGLQIGVTGEGS